MESSELYTLSKDFVKAAIEILKTTKKPLGIIKIKIRNLSENSASLTESLEIDYYILIAREWDRITQLDEYQRLKEYVSKEKDLLKNFEKPINLGTSRRHLDLDTTLQRLIGETLQHSKEFDFDENAFQAAFQRVSSFLLSDTLHVRYLIPLVGLSSDVDKIILENNIKIRRLSIKELERLLNIKYLPILPTFRHAPFKINFCIEIIYEIEKYIEDDKKWGQDTLSLSATTEKIAKRILSVLRLIKRGNVDTLCILCELAELPFEVSWRCNALPPTLLQFKYRLNHEDIDKISIIYQKLKNPPEFLRVPINRLNSAFLKEDPRDKFIDYMIAFEALFSEGPGDLRYKIPLRAARYLGRTPEERRDLFKLFKLAYDVRSDIVHGRGKIQKESRKELKERYGDYQEPILIEKLANDIEDLLRNAILKCLDRDIKNQNQLKQEIEDQFFQ